MMLKMKCFGALAGCMFATGALYASSVTNTFESGTESWTGDGSQAESNFTYTAAVGLPATATLPTPNHVLLVEGTAAYAPSLSGVQKPLLDMMVQTARPDEDLEIPTEDSSDVQIAVAVDSNGCFNVYCTKKTTGTAGWCKLSNTVYEDSAWARVSLLFDYAAQRCQVRIDGQPMMTSEGYLTTNATETATGAWYALAKANSAEVAGVKVIGCTAIDEVVMNETGDSYAIASTATADGVSCAWLDQYGLAWDTTAKYDSSTMTVADKYNYCFSPFDDQNVADFAVKSITTTAEKVTLALPTTVANDGRKVVVDYGTDKTFEDAEKTTTVDVTGTTTVEIDIPAPGSVTYYRLRATNRVSE